MAGVIFLFFSILVGMWVFAKIMYPSRGRLPLPNQDAPAKRVEALEEAVGSEVDHAPLKPDQPAPPRQSALEKNQAKSSLICATCAKPLTESEAITQAGVHFCSAEHLIEYQQIN